MINQINNRMNSNIANGLFTISISQYMQELENAGVDAYLDEFQKQVNQWLKQK